MRLMDMCGCRASMQAGPRIAKGAGSGRIITAGRGTAPIRGAGRRIIMAGGIKEVAAGPGIRAQLDRAITGVPRWWLSSGGVQAAWVLGAVSDTATWAGSP